MSSRAVVLCLGVAVALLFAIAAPTSGELLERGSIVRDLTIDNYVCDVGVRAPQSSRVSYGGTTYTVCRYQGIGGEIHTGGGQIELAREGAGLCRRVGGSGHYGFEFRCLSDRDECPSLMGNDETPAAQQAWAADPAKYFQEHSCMYAVYSDDVREHVILAATFDENQPSSRTSLDARASEEAARSRRW